MSGKFVLHNSIRHFLQLLGPLLVHSLAVEDFRNQPGAMQRRRGIHRTDDELELGEDDLDEIESRMFLSNS